MQVFGLEFKDGRVFLETLWDPLIMSNTRTAYFGLNLHAWKKKIFFSQVRAVSSSVTASKMEEQQNIKKFVGQKAIFTLC